MAKDDPRVTKRRVTMKSVVLGPDDTVYNVERVDYIRPDVLDAFLAWARQNWQQVTVAEKPDAGPGGYHGATHIPAELDHPLAGETFKATPEKERD